MEEWDRPDLVCLYLDAHADARERSPAPPAVTATGIGDALEVGDTVASRLDLLEDLQALQEADLVEAEERPVAGLDVPRTVYYPTAAGRERATALRDAASDETVVVTDGPPEEVPLDDIDRYVEDERTPLVTALARLTADGRVPLEDTDDERFVDRRESLSTVRRAIEDSFTRASRTVVVRGAAGVGKTALVREALDRVSGEREDLVVARGACSAGATDPYGPLRQAFGTVPDRGALLDHLDDARTSSSPDDPQAVQVRRTTFFDDVAEELRAFATDRPVVLFLDNLQWADDATLSLFVHLATAITEWVYPVAFVGAYRSDEVTDDDHPLSAALARIEREGAHDEVALEPLERADTRALLAGVIGRQQLPDAFVDLVHRQTGGNPLFVGETASHLLDTGHVDPDAGVYPTSRDDVALPKEVIDQIDRRLSALDEPSRELLGLGAVLGEHVPGAVLAEASDLPPTSRREYVDVLVASGIWERTGDGASDAGTAPGVTDAGAAPGVNSDGSGDVRFVSGGVREAVVDGLPDALAREYHARAADALTTVYGDHEEHSARVAHHYEQAGDYEAAVAYYQRAGDTARQSYASEVAATNYERALAIGGERGVASDEELAKISWKLANVTVRTGAYETVLDVVERGLEWAAEGSREQCELLRFRATAENKLAKYDRARETARRMREVAVDVGARDLEAMADEQLGVIALDEGQREASREHLERALAGYEAVDNEQGVAIVTHALGTDARRRGEHERARTYFEQALSGYEAVGDRQNLALAHNSLGVLADNRSEYEDARAHYRQALSGFEAVGDEHRIALATMNLGTVDRAQGDYGAARDRYEQALSGFEAVGARQWLATVRRHLGDLARREGDHGVARAHLQRALEIAEAVGNDSEIAACHADLGEVARERGEHATAREHLERAAAALAGAGSELDTGKLDVARGRLALAEGDHERATAAARRARETFESVGATHWIGRSRHLLGRGAAAADEPDVAREHWRAALACFEDVAAPQDALETLRHLVDATRNEGGSTAAWCRRARSTLAEAPEPVAERHADWIARDCPE